jgi:protein TonB
VPIAVATDTSGVAQLRPQETLTGWAMLQARLTTAPPHAAAGTSPERELLSYGQTPSYSGPSAKTLAAEAKASAKTNSRDDSPYEAKLFAYMPGESALDSEPMATARPKRGRVFIFAALAVIFFGLVALPRTRQSVVSFYRSSVGAGTHLLNPPPAALPQAVALHDSFGQSGDEYNLPAPENIPDATTDPSQIRVLPVIDPTAKPQKNSDAITGSEQPPSVGNIPLDQDQSAPNQSAPNQSLPNQSLPNQSSPGPFEPHEGLEAAPASIGDVPRNPAHTRPDAIPARTDPVSNPRLSPPRPQPPALSPAPRSATQHAISANLAAGIPSSLKSHLASSVPQASGSKPVEAAMSSIEPVNLPEPVEREFLIQPVNALYPAAARANGQHGTVVLQVLIGRDGSVQDAKFLQGSLMFAGAAIDAVKQYRFKPYSLNERPVSVQTVITLNFKPPA